MLPGIRAIANRGVTLHRNDLPRFLRRPVVGACKVRDVRPRVPIRESRRGWRWRCSNCERSSAASGLDSVLGQWNLEASSNSWTDLGSDLVLARSGDRASEDSSERRDLRAGRRSTLGHSLENWGAHVDSEGAEVPRGRARARLVCFQRSEATTEKLSIWTPDFRTNSPDEIPSLTGTCTGNPTRLSTPWRAFGPLVASIPSHQDSVPSAA